MLIVDKPGGLLSVPGRGKDKQDCLLSRVRHDFCDALIVHRLDMETSGLMVLARSRETHRQLSQSFEQRRVKKHYKAIVFGQIRNESGLIDIPLRCDWANRPRQKVDYVIGKPSRTYYKVRSYDVEADTTYVDLYPETGRTHQLRIHMKSIGHPIAGDQLYMNGRQQSPYSSGLLLHAVSLEFNHPKTNESVHFVCESPF